MENKQKVSLSTTYGQMVESIKSAQSAYANKMLDFMRKNSIYGCGSNTTYLNKEEMNFFVKNLQFQMTTIFNDYYSSKHEYEDLSTLVLKLNELTSKAENSKEKFNINKLNERK